MADMSRVNDCADGLRFDERRTRRRIELEAAPDQKKLMTTMHVGRSLGVVLPILANLLAATLADAHRCFLKNF